MLQGYWAFATGEWKDGNTFVTTEKIPCKPLTYYTVSADALDTRWQGFIYWDANGDYVSTDNAKVGQAVGYTAQTPATAAYMAFDIGGYPYTQSTIAPSAVKHLQIEEGQTATTYESFGATYSVDWTSVGTVYGGTFDVVTGQLTVDKASVDLGSINWTYQSGYTFPYFLGNMPADCISGSNAPNQVSVICSAYESIPNMAAASFRTTNHNSQCCLNSAVSTKRLIV